MGTDIRLRVQTEDSMTDAQAECSTVIDALQSPLVNPERNIYFLQMGLNPTGVTPPAGNCNIDHSNIDWSKIDVTGGFGSQVMIEYDDDGFYGVSFFQADGFTLLGFETCVAKTIAEGMYPSSVLIAYSYLVPASGAWKTIYGGWWGYASPIRSLNLEGSYDRH